MSDSRAVQPQHAPSFDHSIGLALWWAWIWLVFFPGNEYVVPDMGVFGWWSVALFAGTLSASLFYVLPRMRQTVATPGFSSASAAVCAVCTLALFVLHGGYVIPAICLAFVAGFFSSFWGAHSIMRAVSTDPRTAVAQIACALFSGSVLCLLMRDRSFGVETFLVTLLPLLAPLAWLIISRQIGGEPNGSRRKASDESFTFASLDASMAQAASTDVGIQEPYGEAHVPSQVDQADRGRTQRRMLAIAIFACAATFGTFGGLLTGAGLLNTDETMMVGIASLSLAIWVAALVKPQMINRFSMYFSTIPFYVLGMVFLIAAGVYMRELETMSVLFVIIGWACSLLFGWSYMAIDEDGSIDERGPMVCILLIQAGTLVGTMLLIAGNAAGLNDFHHLALPMIIIILLVLLLVFAAFVLLRTITQGEPDEAVLASDDLDANGGAAIPGSSAHRGDPVAFDASEGEHPVPAMLSVAEFAERMARQYGLSERESEILEPLLRGYSLPKIAEEQGVAKSTVATHAQHIYRKVGVHSRQELIALLDEKQA